MKGMSFLAVVSISFLGICCSSIVPTPSRPVKLTQVELFKVGRSTREEVLKALGAPDRNVIIKGTERYESWAYFEGKFKVTPRVSFNFNSQSGILLSIAWDVRKNEPESNLEQAEKRYLGTIFKHRTPAWTNPHIGP